MDKGDLKMKRKDTEVSKLSTNRSSELFFLIREAAKKVLFLVAGPLRVGGGAANGGGD